MDQEVKITAEPRDPETCKFTVDRPVFDGKSAFFDSPQKAKGSPLVEALFEVEGVRAVLVHHDMVTVNTTGTLDWYPVAKEVGSRIRAALTSGEPPISSHVLDGVPEENVLREKIQMLFDREINPALMQHGGSVRLLDVKGNEVYIQLGGGCVGCGMVDVTLKNGIERAIREMEPSVGAILDTTDHASGRNPYYARAR
jgi:Fe-S cluster biogenesis protein NfuA